MVTTEFDNESLGDYWSDENGCRLRPIGHTTLRAFLFRHGRYFTRPGMTRDLAHELSLSDRFGHFCHYFRMPLSKVEELTNLLTTRGYVPFPWTKLHRRSFTSVRNFWLCVRSTSWGWVWCFGHVSHCAPSPPLRYTNFIICSLVLLSTYGRSKYSCQGILLH